MRQPVKMLEVSHLENGKKLPTSEAVEMVSEPLRKEVVRCEGESRGRNSMERSGFRER